MKINNVSQLLQGELRKTDANARKTEREQAQNGNVGTAPREKDRSELSTDGREHREASEIAMVASMVKAQPDIRAERVALAESRLASGFYNTPDFASKLAAKLAPTFA